MEYDGRHYSGWQAQPHLDVDTVQESLEAALARVANEPVRVHCAGRTDTGVHGFGQIVHFDDPVGRSPKAWVLGTNASLPASVRLHWAQQVGPGFHARFSATSRRYRYLIYNSAIRPAQLDGLVTWQRRPLDASLMDQAAQQMLGERDFSAFRAASCQASTPMRDMQAISVSRHGALIAIDLRANAFLHHMVRNIAGTLMMIGSGQAHPNWVAELLEAGDRRVAADTAPAAGLYLVEVSYPENFDLPRTTLPLLHLRSIRAVHVDKWM